MKPGNFSVTVNFLDSKAVRSFDGDLSLRRPAARAHPFDLLHHVRALGHLAEDHVLAVEPRVSTVVMKNCEPLVFGPALAIDRMNGLSCLSWKFSSLNFYHRSTCRRCRCDW